MEVRVTKIFFLIFVFCVSLQVDLIKANVIDVDKAVAEFIAKHTVNGTGVDLNTWEAPKDMQRDLVYYLSGYDEDNRPIWIAEWGKWDVKKYVDEGGKSFQNFDNYIDQQLVRMLQSLKLRKNDDGELVNELIFILDLEGYPLEQLSSTSTVIYELRKVAGWVEIAQVIEKGYFLNTNFFAEKMLSLAKPILGSVFERFEIHGTNKEKWIPKLLKNIPRSEIPEWYGGVKDFKPLKVYGR